MKKSRAEYLRNWKQENPLKVSVYIAVCNARLRAKKRGVPFELPKGAAATLADESKGVCALSGIPFRKTDVPGHKSMWSPSLDRIRPELGYVLGNVRLILDGLNGLKAHGTDEEVFEICRAVVEKHQ